MTTDQMLGSLLRAATGLAPRRWLGSLSRHVDGLEKQWHRQDSDLQRSSWFEIMLLRATAHPWIFLLLVILSWAAIAGSMFGLAQHCQVSLSLWQRSDLPTYFGTAWSVQATVAALVYPLVVSFVAHLLQRRTTAKIALVAYLLETGVKPSGASSFALMVWMTLQYLLLPWTPTEHVQAFMVANVAWLAANLLLTGWFLTRTAQYLQDYRRVRTLLWLTQCITLPREVRAHAKGLLLQNAQAQGLIPGADLSSDTADPKVVLYKMGEGHTALTAEFSVPMVLHDVHFSLLAWAVRRWMGRLSADSKHPMLELPGGFDRASKSHELCRVRDACRPNVLERAAIIAAYRFVRPTTNAMPFSSTEVMEELAQEAVAQIELGRDPEFRQALDDLMQVHCGLLRAAQHRTEDGSVDSAALLQDPNGWGSRAISREWMEPYRAIAETAVASLENNERYFLRATAISAKLIHESGDQPSNVLVDLMLSSSLLAYHMGLWWGQKILKESASSTEDARMLSAPLRSLYSDVTQSWVGSWEGIYVRISKDRELSDRAHWNAERTRARVYAAHIDETARLLLSAVARGDAEMARRLEDSLIKWWGGRQHEFGPDSDTLQPGWMLLNIGISGCTWDEAQARIANLPQGSQAISAATGLLSSLLWRYWKDVCMVTTLVLLEHAADSYASEPRLSVEISSALMAGRGYDDGGIANTERHPHVGAALYQLAGAQFSDTHYSQRLDQIVERFRSDTRAPMTSGRIYSLSGPDDVNSLTKGQGIYCVVCVAGRLDDLREFGRLVDFWQQDLARLDRISRHFSGLAAAIRAEAFENYDPLLGALGDVYPNSDTDPVKIDNAKLRAAASCDEAARRASAARQSTVNDAPIDATLIEDLTRRVHEGVFAAGEQSEFPFDVTTEFVADDNVLASSQQRFAGVSKLPFTSPQLEQLDDQLVHYFSKYTARRAFLLALTRLQRSIGIEPIRDDNSEVFFLDLEHRIAALIEKGWTPVILVRADLRRNFLSPYRLPEDGDVPSGFAIRVPEGPSSGVFAFVNDVEVYAVPMEVSRYLVAAKEWFKTIRYRPLNGTNGVLAEVSNENAGRVDVTFEFACEFSES